MITESLNDSHGMLQYKFLNSYRYHRSKSRTEVIARDSDLGPRVCHLTSKELTGSNYDNLRT
jgi:hypothetical protein